MTAVYINRTLCSWTRGYHFRRSSRYK